MRCCQINERKQKSARGVTISDRYHIRIVHFLKSKFITCVWTVVEFRLETDDSLLDLKSALENV